jgi:cytochrome c peroxidase
VAVHGTPYRFTFSKRFPMPQLPLDNPLTEEGVELGRRLFHEPLLSINEKQSCASCHQDAGAFAQPGLRFSPGAEGFFGKRNTMPLFNLAWKSSFFWDGRAPSLRAQARVPIEDPIEMHETVTNIAVKLAATAEYPTLFERAFGTSAITPDRIGLALEQFVLTLISCDSRFDRALEGREEFTEEEKRGFALFSMEYDPQHDQFGADCFHCHGGSLFSNGGFANNGLDTTFTDPGLSVVTGVADDEGKFAVPSLRNVAITAPYMHDGRFATLNEVVEHYVSGIKRSATLDPNIAKHPDGGVVLSDDDKKAIVAFLKTLTDRRFTDAPPPRIPASARSAARAEAVPP